MHEILHKERLGPDITLYTFHAPDVAAYRQPGQFVLMRISEDGERIPITIADVNREKGTITLIVQSVGKTTLELFVQFHQHKLKDRNMLAPSLNPVLRNIPVRDKEDWMKPDHRDNHRPDR